MSDASAHASDAFNSPTPKIDHPLVCPDAPTLVTNQPALLELIAHLRSAGSFAYDSEFIGELSYFPKLCLVQVSTPRRIGLIDPLAEVDLTPFWELVADPAVEKIVHAGLQDLEPVYRAIGKPPANLFDVQLGAGFVGFGYPLSLQKLVLATLETKIQKGLTFTHWDRRPLTDHQLGYAADDVRFLPAIREELNKRLIELNYAPWVSEESAALCDPAMYAFDPDGQYLKLRGSGGLPPRQLAVLRELFLWRDQTARREDSPPRSLVKDEVLLAMAKSPIKSIGELDRIRGLPRQVETEYGPQIVAATARALVLPVEQCPEATHYEPSPREKFRADALFYAAQCLCGGLQIDPGLVTSRQEVGELHRRELAGQPMDGMRILTGWRGRLVGNWLLDVMRGTIDGSPNWVAGSLHAILGAQIQHRRSK